MNLNIGQNIYIKKFLEARESAIFFAFLSIFVILTFATPHFIRITNLLNIGRQISFLGMMGIGLGIVIITGNIDLSIGSVYGLAAVVTALTMVKTGNSFISILFGVIAGTSVGLANGWLLVKIKLPAFIVTFGMMNVVRGLILIITNGYPITLFLDGITNETHPGFYFIGGGKLFNNIPMQLIIMAFFMLFFGYILHRTIFGLHIFAVGDSEKAAHASGINSGAIKIKSLLISSFLASVAGILNLAFIGSVQATSGQGLEFETFAAVIIGGVSFAGGEGSIAGILIGTLIIGIIRNGLVLLGVGPFMQVLIVGLIAIGAVAYDSLTWEKRQERRLSL